MNLATAVINLNHLRHNVKYLKSLSRNSILYPVIKANAYGHGFKEIARALQEINIEGVCIATINELKDLISLNFKYSILHLGKISIPSLNIYKNKNVIATINSIEDIESINKLNTLKTPIRVHIKIDTGMSRMGCDVNDFKKIFNKCLESKHIKLEGIYSHLANSDNKNIKLNQKQIDLFESIIHKIKKQDIKDIKFHILNSGGLFNYGKYKYDLIRTGLSIYGISPLGIHNDNLKPVMEFKAPLILKKCISKGTMVGYGNSYQADGDMDVAIIQCGYGDGIPFEYSNKGFVYYKKSKMPVIGRVSMDLICIDITEVDINIGDYITLWGSMSNKETRLEYIAKYFNNIPYTFMIGITNRVKKRYVYE